MMEKNAVLGGSPSIQTKIASRGCPICGGDIDLSGSLPRCSEHGTAPFEKGASMSRTRPIWKKKR
jgi:hypothetical protein